MTKVERPNLTAEDIASVKAMVIHQDDQVIAFNKPAGLSSQGGRIKAHTLDDLLWAFAKASGNRPRLIHRLDRDTSGVILTGRTQPDASFLGKAVQAKRLRKTYLAIVAPGAPKPKGGEINVPLRREEIGRESYMRVSDDLDVEAQDARTIYRTLASNDEAALVELNPVTGRMHQLRVHLASIGRSIVGDVRYGGALTLGARSVPRLMLHAKSLVFPHPDLSGPMTVSAPIPDDFEAVLAQADLAYSPASATPGS